jgi:hypothetical protein
MLALLFAGVGSLVDGMQIRDRHQATYTMDCERRLARQIIIDGDYWPSPIDFIEP